MPAENKSNNSGTYGSIIYIGPHSRRIEKEGFSWQVHMEFSRDVDDFGNPEDSQIQTGYKPEVYALAAVII